MDADGNIIPLVEDDQGEGIKDPIDEIEDDQGEEIKDPIDDSDKGKILHNHIPNKFKKFTKVTNRPRNKKKAKIAKASRRKNR